MEQGIIGTLNTGKAKAIMRLTDFIDEETTNALKELAKTMISCGKQIERLCERRED